MNALYKVRYNDFGQCHVLAESFQDAADKVKETYPEWTVKSIEFLSDKIIE